MTIRIGIIGPGNIAQNKLLPALTKAKGAELWSVLSRDVERAVQIAQQHNASAPKPAHGELNAMLSDPDLDAVIIATPDGLHAQQAIAAAEAGKHVLCEKPMATSLEEADAMIAACDKAGVKLGVAYHLRWHPAHRQLHKAVSEGFLGELRHMRVQWSFQAPDAQNWRAGADVGRWWGLAGVGTHCLDQILWFLEPHCGEIVDMKSTITRKVWGGPHDETALLSFTFENGTTADLCSSVLFQAPNRFELYGSKGYAISDDTVATTGEGNMRTHKGAWEYDVIDPYQAEIEDFVSAIQDDRPPEVDGHMGRKNTAILIDAVS